MTWFVLIIAALLLSGCSREHGLVLEIVYSRADAGSMREAGDPVPRADVEVSGGDFGEAGSADADGVFELDSVPARTLVVRADEEGELGAFDCEWGGFRDVEARNEGESHTVELDMQECS